MPQHRRISFTVPADLHAQLAAFATRDDLTVDEYCALAIAAVADAENELAAPPHTGKLRPTHDRDRLECAHPASARSPEPKIPGLDRCSACGQVVTAR